LRQHRDRAFLYRQLATLRTDVPLSEGLDDLRWRGARRVELAALCADLDDDALPARIPVWAP
jgi:5'-3' exonuclease